MAKSKAIVVNPRKKRRRRRHASARRVSNPRGGLGGIGNTLRASAPTMGGGLAGGFVSGYLDTKFLSDKPLVSILSKLVLAIGGAAALRRRAPALAAGFAGGVMGGLGYSVGVKLGGGMVAHTKASALQGLGAMADDDATGKLSDVVDTAGLGDVVGLADGEDDYAGDGGMGDVTTLEGADEDEAAVN